jgi:hypothetical protein
MGDYGCASRHAIILDAVIRAVSNRDTSWPEFGFMLLRRVTPRYIQDATRPDNTFTNDRSLMETRRHLFALTSLLCRAFSRAGVGPIADYRSAHRSSEALGRGVDNHLHSTPASTRSRIVATTAPITHTALDADWPRERARILTRARSGITHFRFTPGIPYRHLFYSILISILIPISIATALLSFASHYFTPSRLATSSLEDCAHGLMHHVGPHDIDN